jgi:predicted RNase H-like HicB family nuclease
MGLMYRYRDSNPVSGLRIGSRGPCAVDLWSRGHISGHCSQVPAARRPTRYRFDMAASVDFTISFDSPDEQGWIVARVLEVPGAISQGRTREEARENVLDALRTVFTPDEEFAGEASGSDREHMRFVPAA